MTTPSTNASSSTIASDPAAAENLTADEEAAAQAAANGVGTSFSTATASPSTAGASTFPSAINPQLVDPSAQFGIGAASWWQQVENFLQVLQKTMADAQASALSPRQPGQSYNAQRQSNELFAPVVHAVEDVGHLIDAAGNAITPGSPTHTAAQSAEGNPKKKQLAPKPATRAAGDLAELRQAAKAVGVVIPANVTSVQQLGSIKVPVGLRQELAQGGFNPMAIGTLMSLSQQTTPLNQVESPVTANDLYKQFVNDWGHGTSSFATGWTADLVAAGLLPPTAVANNVGAAQYVGDAYQTLLGAAADDHLTPAQELTKMQTSSTNPNAGVNSGVAVDAENAARQVFYQYGINPSTGTIQSIVQQTLASGFSSPYEVTDQAEALAGRQAIAWAKQMFPSVANQITDANSVQQIVAPFLNTASQMLGLNQDAIDITDPKWQKALTGGANGGQMTMDEWAKTLASDPTYGYMNSQAAKNSAASLGESLRNLFGLNGPDNAGNLSYTPGYQVS